MRIRLYSDFGRLPLGRSEWNALARRGSVDSVFQTHEWATAWWKCCGASHRLLYLTAEDAGGICGFAPLMATPGSAELRFLADANSDYCDITADGNRYAVLDAMLHFLVHEQRDWRRLTLRNVPECSATLAALLTLGAKHRLYPRLSARIATPRIDFRSQDAPFRLKYSVRRHSNRLARLGALEYRVARSRSELPAMLDALYAQHVARYREKGQHSLFENADCRRFYALLADELLDTGWLHFSELRLDGRSIATHFGFDYNKVLTWYKPAFDIAYRQYSPGTALIKHLIDYAGERGLDTLDFTIGNEPFKERFSNAVAYNRTLTLYRNRPSAYLCAAKDLSALTIKHFLQLLRGTDA